MIIVDDADNIKRQYLDGLMQYIKEEFGIVIQTWNNNIKFDMKERIKESSLYEDYEFWTICPFYSDRRKKLVSKIVPLLRKEESVGVESQENLIAFLCETLSKQRFLFSLTPDFIIQFTQYYCNNIGETIQNDGSVFSKVFEANLVALIKPYAIKMNIDKIFIILDKIAYEMHTKKEYPMLQATLCNVIDIYNEEFDSDVNMLDFVNVLIESKIIERVGSKYKFCERNYLSYFVAREIKRKCLEENDYSEFRKALDFACYGINSDILLFVTYITDSVNMIKMIMERAEAYVSGWTEFSIYPIEIPYLSDSDQLETDPVQEGEKEEVESQEVEIEKKEELVKVEKKEELVYGYNENNLSETDKIVRVLSLMIILSRTLPSFEHMMKKPEKEKCVELIYTLPLKIFNTWAKEIEKNKLELIEELKLLKEWSYRNAKRPVDVGEELNYLRWESMSLLLEIMNVSIGNATKDNTHRFIDMFDYKKKISYEIEHLMGLDKRDATDLFIKEIATIYEAEKEKVIKFLLERIAKHHILTSRKITFQNIQRMNERFWHGKLKAREIIVQKEKNKKKLIN